jgi:hypothetical protein
MDDTGTMIQETEMKQRSARMVDSLKSFQFIEPSPGQDAPVQSKPLHRDAGGAFK